MCPISKKPLVSILTPSFEQAAWLPANLHSVACQTYANIEHVVMDGGSTDGSVEILEQAGERVRWRSEPDRGQAHAINKAFAASSGEIIGWLNSDDAYFDCQVVERVVELFEVDPALDVVYGHALQLAEDGTAIQVLTAHRFDADLLRAVDFICQPTAFIRRSALSEPMLDETFHFAMDYELWLRLMTDGKRFARLNRFIAIDRHQRARKSSTIKDTYRENLDRLSGMYEMRLDPEWESTRTSYYKRQRLAGALLVPRIRGPFAFDASPSMKRGLLRRQALQRKSAWPEEYR